MPSTQLATRHATIAIASTERTGKPAFEDRIFLNRILGLSNLYYIDPEDQEILTELREVRLQTVQLMLSVGMMSLVGSSNPTLVIVSGPWLKVAYRKKASDANEVQQRDAMQQWLSQTPNSLHQDGGIQRFAAALLFLPWKRSFG